MNELKRFLIIGCFNNIKLIMGNKILLSPINKNHKAVKECIRKTREFYNLKRIASERLSFWIYLKPSDQKGGLPDSISSLPFAVAMNTKEESNVYFDVHTMEIIARN